MDQASIPTDPNQLALYVLQCVTSGNWRAVAALGVLAIVFAIRNWALTTKILARFPRLGWLKTDKGGVALNFIVSALGGVGNALAAHAAVNAQVLLTAAINSCIAAGVFVSVKRLAGRPAENAAPPATPSDDASITTTTSTDVPK